MALRKLKAKATTINCAHSYRHHLLFQSHYVKGREGWLCGSQNPHWTAHKCIHSSPRESGALFQPPWEPNTHGTHTHGKENNKTKESNFYSSLFLYCCDKNTLIKTIWIEKDCFSSLCWHQGVDSCKTLLTGSKVEILRECSSLTCFPWLSCTAHTHQARVTRPHGTESSHIER